MDLFNINHSFQDTPVDMVIEVFKTVSGKTKHSSILKINFSEVFGNVMIERHNTVDCPVSVYVELGPNNVNHWSYLSRAR